MLQARDDQRQCRELLRHNSRTFFLASLLLPATVRAPASALYAFCRVADDADDLAGDGGGHPVKRLRARLDRVYAGRPADHAPDRAFADVVSRFAIPRAVPEALLEGFDWDLAGHRYGTIDELHAYGARVAGSVGAMMAAIMGVKEPQVLERACDLGVAMQYTNIARDVGEDARAGRLYLPLDWMRAEGLDPDAWLAAPAPGARLAAVIRRLLEAADVLYRRADAGIGCLPADCRPAMHAARRLYAEIGRTVEANGYDSVTRRAVVPTRRKFALLARAVAESASSAPWTREPGMPQTAYLVEALVAGNALRNLVPEPRGLEARVAWLVDLFGRLETLEHGPRPQRSSAGP